MNPPARILTSSEFKKCLSNITGDLLGLAAEVALSLSAKPELKQEWLDDGINPDLISRLQKLGEGSLEPSLVFATSPGAVRLIALPRHDQTEFIKNGVEVLEPDGQNTRIIPVDQLTAKQAAQVFARGRARARTIAEQRSYQNERAPKATAPPEAYIVTKKGVKGPMGFLPRELILQWVAEMG